MIKKLLRWLQDRIPHPAQVYETEEFIANLEPSPVDLRDQDYAVLESGFDLPTEYSLKSLCGLVRNQGGIGSCVSFTLVSALEVLNNRDGEPNVELSDLYHYYKARQPGYMGTFPRDSGMYIRTGIKCLRQEGAAPDVLWPYDEGKYNERPDIFSRSFARFFRVSSYHRCFSPIGIKEAITMQMPVSLGVRAYTGMYYPDSVGNITDTGNHIGGHAMLVVGYDDSHRNPDGSFGAFEVKNSWGTRWGASGYGWISYNQVRKQFIEAWALER